MTCNHDDGPDKSGLSSWVHVKPKPQPKGQKIMALRYALTETAETVTANAHMIDLSLVISNVGLILVSMLLAYATWKLHKTTMAELHHSTDRNAQVADNAIDSMENVATHVVEHNRQH